MQIPQAFGSASSYGKKYALGNLLLIDDTQDADASNTHGKTPEVKAKLSSKDPAFAKAKEFITNGGSIDTIKSKYDLSKDAIEILSKL
jgi:nucleoside phosphorylase